MVVLELASSTGSSRGRSSKTTKESLFEGAGSSKWWFWNWPATRAAAGAGVPKPPKNRFLKAREAQNGGFGTGQGRGRAGAAAGAAAGAGFILGAMIGSAIKKCTPDSREGRIFLIRPVLLRNSPDPGTAT